MSTPKVYVNKSTATTDDMIKISCNAVDNATWYWMSLYKDNKLYINQALDNSLNFSKKLPVGSYKADISAHNDYADSESGSVSFTVKRPNLDSPKIKVTTSFDTNTSNHVIKVTWDKILNADNYIINYGIEGSTASKEKELGNTTSDTYTLGKNALNNQGTSVGFWFKVKAKNSSGASSDWSNINTVYLYPGCYGIHNYGPWLTSKAATCTADGTQTRKCSICGSTESNTISKTGHSLGNWTTSKNATCTSDGTKTRKCKNCNYSESETIPKTGHKYSDKVVSPTCTEKGYTLHTCSACNDSYKDKETDAKGHTFTSKMIDGYMTYVCSDCGYMYTAPFEGEGTAESPFIISNADELRAVSDTVNNTEINQIFGHAYYKQTADIDLENISWTPIGIGYDGEDGKGEYNCQTRMFFGVYDGNQHTIYNLNVENHIAAGLFGCVRNDGAEVCNLVVYGNINSDNDSGGITGGLHYGAKITNCAFIGDVKGNLSIGGITGYINGGASIINCYHNGNVTDGNNMGGIVGEIAFNQYSNNNASTIIENCYQSNGEVIGACYDAIVGHCNYYKGKNNIITIKNCYSTYTGNTSAVIIPSGSSYYDNTLELSVSQLKKIAEDLGEAYTNNTNPELNNGFPVFQWQLDIMLKGDANNNGIVDVNDAIMLQDWLLGASDELTNWENVDLCEDGVIDVFDLCLLKRLLAEYAE